ncbi:spore protease YyaC [Paenibacillus sp. 1P07SE]|uniref:spore protease YyaC n=1 Tax=Paenibacillus sp. 1P07SE TaxID=3132209 RepID=UPI0039A76F88
MKLAARHDLPLKIAYTEPNVQSILTDRLTSHLSQLGRDRQLAIVCIGTDRSTGDALGPLVGSALSKSRSPLFHIYGTLEAPVHALNLQDTLDEIDYKHSSPYIIGIDACLGQVSSIGCIQLGQGPVRPGAGVNKDLPPVGELHMTGIVNVGGFMEYFVLQNTRLHLVMQMADLISGSLLHSILSVRPTSMTAATQE